DRSRRPRPTAPRRAGSAPPANGTVRPEARPAAPCAAHWAGGTPPNPRSRCNGRALRSARAPRGPGPAVLAPRAAPQSGVPRGHRRPPARRRATSHLAPSMLPSAPECDPEREEDESHVEPEAPPARVHAVVPELLPGRDVAVGVDLSDPGQPRRHGVTLAVPGNGLERDDPAVAAGVDLAGAEGAWPHEAHVAAEYVPELGQLVHGRRAKGASDARHAWVVFFRLPGAEEAVGVRHHRPELQDAELP